MSVDEGVRQLAKGGWLRRGNAKGAAEDKPIAKVRTVTSWYSVRRDVLLWAVGLPLLLLAVFGLLGYQGFRWFEEQEDANHAIQVRFVEASKSYNEVHAKEVSAVQIVKGFAINMDRLKSRANELAVELHIVPEIVNENLSVTELVPLPPMGGKLRGLRLRLQGAPGQIHRLFGLLEKDFPAITVMATKLEATKGGLLVVETVYLLPDYENLSR